MGSCVRTSGAAPSVPLQEPRGDEDKPEDMCVQSVLPSLSSSLIPLHRSAGTWWGFRLVACEMAIYQVQNSFFRGQS